MKTILQILKAHMSRYPYMQVQDLYKLLHQTTFGSEHAIKNEESARKWLEQELNEMNDGPDEPLLDPISPGGEIIRVHLRPYFIERKDPKFLLIAFLRTAKEWRGSKETLRSYAQVAAQLADSHGWPLHKFEIEAFFAKMEAMDYPAAHHSAIYSDLYRPAYRVVARRFLEAE